MSRLFILDTIMCKLFSRHNLIKKKKKFQKTLNLLLDRDMKAKFSIQNIQ